jgi:hypothetical protein
MAFSCQADGASKDPLIGLAFYQGRIFSSAPGVNWKHFVLSRVTADLSKEAGNTIQDNLRNLCDRLRKPNRAGMNLNPKGYEANPPGGNGWDVNTKTGGKDLIVNTTLGDSVPYDGAPLIEKFMANITLWVRDSKSWFATDSSW